jgi:hypothetical protein
MPLLFIPSIDRRRANLRGLAALGMVMPFADQVKPQMDQIGSQLQAAQSSIDSNNQAILALEQSQPGIDLRAEGQQQVQAQNQLNTYRDDFTLVYRAVFGTVPPGMSGLGQFDPTSLLTIAGVVAALGVISAGIYAVIKITNTVSQSLQVKQTQANSYSYAQQQLSDAQQRGDAAAAAQWAAVLAQTSAAGGGTSSQSFGDFLKSNLGWVAAGVAGIFLVRELL